MYKITKTPFILMVCLLLAFAVEGSANPLKRLNFSVWTNYSEMQFDGLSQEEKTAKLQKLFEDKVTFAKNYGTRRLLIKILNPAEFDFFKTERYDAMRDDNFYYWALKLSKQGQIEAVFDTGSFGMGEESWTNRLYNYGITFLKKGESTGEFLDLNQKLAWVSFMNEMTDPNGKEKFLIDGITIDPINLNESQTQDIINLLDQYRNNAHENLPNNPCSSIRLGIYLGLDQKDLAYCNLSRFPLGTDTRGQHTRDIGVTPPENFPSKKPNYLAPDWRQENNNTPLLDTIYLKMADKRLIESIYQNHAILHDPTVHNKEAVKTLAANLGDDFRGIPFVKGPGKITSLKGATAVEGMYTFFKTGGGTYQKGQFVGGGTIEVRPPFVSKVTCKVIESDPENNRTMKITSSFSTVIDVENAEYYQTATPIAWNTPRISNSIRTKIYFVFSTTFQTKERRFFGNWCLNNFLDFLSFTDSRSKIKHGFLYEPIFTGFNGEMDPPVCNMVLTDFTTIPNGNPYPECNWGLGNQNHH